MEEQAVAAELLAQALDGAVGDAAFPGNLAETGAGQQAIEDGLEELGWRSQ